MSRLPSTAALIALAISTSAHAAQDMGLTLHNGSDASITRRAVGAQASVTLRLGDRHIVRDAEKVTLGIAAGPMLTVPKRGGIGDQRLIGGLTALKIKPGYSASIHVGGQPLVTSYSKLGAADREAEQQETPRKKQKTEDKVAWVGLVAGGVMVVLAGVALISINSSSGKE